MTDAQSPNDWPSIPPPPSIGPPNYWAVASLLCGIVGCVFFTPVLAIGFGIAGLKRAQRTGVGRPMAKLGLSLGIAWLALFAAGGLGSWWISQRGAMSIAAAHRSATVELINSLPAGHLDRSPNVYRIGPGRAKELAAAVESLGTCQDVQISDAYFTNRDGVFGVVFEGTALFEHGKWPVRVRLFYNGTGFGFSELDWQ